MVNPRDSGRDREIPARWPKALLWESREVWSVCMSQFPSEVSGWESIGLRPRAEGVALDSPPPPQPEQSSPPPHVPGYATWGFVLRAQEWGLQAGASKGFQATPWPSLWGTGRQELCRALGCPKIRTLRSCLESAAGLWFSGGSLLGRGDIGERSLQVDADPVVHGKRPRGTRKEFRNQEKVRAGHKLSWTPLFDPVHLSSPLHANTPAGHTLGHSRDSPGSSQH